MFSIQQTALKENYDYKKYTYEVTEHVTNYKYLKNTDTGISSEHNLTVEALRPLVHICDFMHAYFSG